MEQIQKLAIEVLTEVDTGKQLTEVLASCMRQHPELSSAERGALQDISYGVLRFQARLRYMLKKLVSRTLPNKQIGWLLLVALYQLFHTRAAAYAVVNEAVRAAASLFQGRFKGFCNAVLRNALRQPDTLLIGIENDEQAYYNHPQWWIQVLQQAYPLQWQLILERNDQHPPMILRVNSRKISPAQSLAMFHAKEIGAVLLADGAIHVKRPMAVQELPGFAEGYVSVQDWGAQQAALRLALHDGLRVLDACAAPGGKTCHMLELADVEVTALDVSARRLERVRENLNRLGLQAHLIVADASRLESWWDGRPFDRILADVPCSASGVVRRHPDIKWLRRSTDIAELVKQQVAIMDALWSALATSGKMLYATCSIFPAENGMQLAAFLARHPDAECGDQEQLLPSQSHDGFYYALLQKH